MHHLRTRLLERLPIALVAASLLLAADVGAQSSAVVDPRLYAGLTWRKLGPFRAGRVAAVSGVIGQAGTFYIGLPAAGPLPLTRGLP